MMNATYMLNNVDLAYLDELLLTDTGQLQILPYEQLKDVPQEHLSVFCVRRGFYAIPTQELIDFLTQEIGSAKAIEIGAGHGAICKALGVTGTDNFMQSWPEIRDYYDILKQTPVPYGEHVKRFDALDAVRRFKPEIVVAAWCTHKYDTTEHWRGGNQYGIDENALLGKVKKYIHIGNEGVHNKKPVLSLPHRIIKAEWILSRSVRRNENEIRIWERGA